MLSLPQPDHTPLDQPSLPLVVAQARLASSAQEISQEVVSDFQTRLRARGFDLPRVKPIATSDIVVGVVGPAAPMTSVTTKGFQLTTEDGGWLVTLTPDSVAVETPAFRSFAEQFGPRLEHIVSAATEAVHPVTLARAGLRFVNLLRRPTGPDAGPDGQDWSGWVRPSLVAVRGDDLLAPGLVSVAQQVLLDVEVGVRAAVRTGPARVDGDEAMVLDIDVYSEPSQLWRAEDVVARFERLNSCGVALFQVLVTPEMLTQLRAAGASEGTGDDARTA
jgi:uncharacterized protein (TIGR04255 family)